MPLTIAAGDITKVKADAIVNAANIHLAPGGGVCGAIFAAAGSELEKECREIGFCAPGNAVITSGGRSGARYIIHAVGPIWKGGVDMEEEYLASAYTSALRLAAEHKVKTVAFPLISAGIYGYPREAALQVATRAINDFLDGHPGSLKVILTLYDTGDFSFLSPGLREELADLESEILIRKSRDRRRDIFNNEPTVMRLISPEPDLSDFLSEDEPLAESGASCEEPLPQPASAVAARSNKPAFSAPQAPLGAEGTGAATEDQTVKDFVRETYDRDAFLNTVDRFIREKNVNINREFYRRTNLSRQTFSKINCKTRKPTKNIALALAIGMRLNEQETDSLLKSGGWVLSDGDPRDVIVRCFINNRDYDIYHLNSAIEMMSKILERPMRQLGQTIRPDSDE
ncbi:MAG: macro domain-containing protein [Abditibacteriota bacterium]|nr:macro domain-containing protein [Abditibacteriota bacterium]